jgi:hypothetical protein
MSKLNHPPSSEQACLNCYYSRAAGASLYTCRCMPPALVEVSGRWPLVEDTDWCGEWAPREES